MESNKGFFRGSVGLVKINGSDQSGQIIGTKNEQKHEFSPQIGGEK